jgi:NAD(P)-dependent dehydrogenase (short-subunit alcohol dehydrogenase family)
MAANTQALAGRHALVTGGGRGIGAAIAAALAGAGARVTLLGRTAAELETTAASLPGSALAVTADVTDPAQVARAFAAARAASGEISILVNNAGLAKSRPLAKTEEAFWRAMLEVNLTGAFHCTQAALPAMLAANWGRIVSVASTAGLRGYAYCTAYCAAKHGLVGFTRALALEVAKTGVTVNAVCPGYTDTGLVRDAIRNISEKTARSEAEARESLVTFNPQQRLVQPAEVASAVLWLCSPGSESMNGQSLAVAGGEVT